MKKKDMILISVILIFIIILFGINQIINSKATDSIDIYVNSELYESISINSKKEFKITVDDGYNTIKIHDKGVEIVDASCPDKVCVHTGFISKASQSIVCIPNKVNIKIEGENKDNEDIISN